MTRCFAILLSASTLLADVQPATLRQGETAVVRSRKGAATARVQERSVPMFAQPDGTTLGLMPVAHDHAPGRYRLSVFDTAGSLVEAFEIEVLGAGFPVDDVKVRPGGKRLEPLPGEMEAVAALRNRVSAARHWEAPFAAPVPGCMNTPFGVARSINGKLTGNYHRGVDQRGPRKTPIRAAAAGRVEIARKFRLHGGTVGIDHGQGLTSIYLHMSRLAAKEGRMVEKGAVIGYVGATGFATGPHLHWQIWVHGVPVNPLQWAPSVNACH